MRHSLPIIVALAVALHAFTFGEAQAIENHRVAQELANPIGQVTNIALDMAYGENLGPRDGGYWLTLTAKPYFTLNLGQDWRLVSQSSLPFIYQHEIYPAAGDQIGWGDLVQNFYISPSTPTQKGISWGVGPVFLFPTATHNFLGSEKWAVGPSVALAYQHKGLTLGITADHLWEVAADEDPSKLSKTCIYPTISFTTSSAWTYTLRSEAIYSWPGEVWSIPISFTIGKTTRIGDLPVQLRAGITYWAESTDNGPEKFGALAGIVFLFPKK